MAAAVANEIAKRYLISHQMSQERREIVEMKVKFDGMNAHSCFADRENCRKCQEQGIREAMEHLLRTCPALARQGFKQLVALGTKHWKMCR